MSDWHTMNEEPRHNAKVVIRYRSKDDVYSEGVGYYMFCGSSYVFNIGGFAVESDRVLNWRYCNI